MVLVLPVAVAIVLALACGGDLRRVSELRLRRIELLYLAMAFQLVAFPLAFMPWHVSDGIASGIWLVSYAALCAGAFLNVRIAGVPVVTAGMLSNVAAVAANGGHMPALPSALRDAGKSAVVHYNSAPSASPNLPWLVDRWALPDWLPLGNVFSVGDVVIGAGAFVLVFRAMGARVTFAPFARPARG